MVAWKCIFYSITISSNYFFLDRLGLTILVSSSSVTAPFAFLLRFGFGGSGTMVTFTTASLGVDDVSTATLSLRAPSLLGRRLCFFSGCRLLTLSDFLALGFRGWETFGVLDLFFEGPGPGGVVGLRNGPQVEHVAICWLFPWPLPLGRPPFPLESFKI